jgi:hypothetical protein
MALLDLEKQHGLSKKPGIVDVDCFNGMCEMIGVSVKAVKFSTRRFVRKKGHSFGLKELMI